MNVEWNPVTVYNKLLNPTTIQTAGQRNARIRNVTDLVMESYVSTINNRRIGSEDKLRLNNYMDLITDTHKQLGVAVAACQQASNPGDQRFIQSCIKL